MGLTWMTKEMRNNLKKRDEIVKNQDFNALFELSDSEDFSIALLDILSNQSNYNPDKLNHCQKVLFLCMQLENFSQADGILSFLQEEFSEYTYDVINALYEIGATNSGKIIEQATKLLPNDGTWFFKIANESEIALMKKLDAEFSNYPDGRLWYLYREYAEKHKTELSKIV